MGRACSMHDEEVFLVGKLDRKRLLGRPRRTLEDNIKMDLRGIG
jgi:hypothetical protein